MAYYLQWSADSGNKDNNKETLEISGIVGALISVEYKVKNIAAPYTGINRYLFDIRRSIGSTANGGGAAYILRFSTGYNTTGTSNFKKNGAGFSDPALFFTNYEPDDVFKFDVNAVPSAGAIAFGARYNEVEHSYGMAVSEVIITDDNGAHTINMSDSGGSGSSLTSTDSQLTATLFNFPTDGSQWVPYADSPPSTAPSNVSGALIGGDAQISWDSVADVTGYYFEFRRRS